MNAYDEDLEFTLHSMGDINEVRVGFFCSYDLKKKKLKKKN